jgi:hypothetical protein
MRPQSSVKARYLLHAFALASFLFFYLKGISGQQPESDHLLRQLSRTPVLQGISRIRQKSAATKNPLRIVYYGAVKTLPKIDVSFRDIF